MPKFAKVLQQYRGTEINTSGDGFLAAFDGPAQIERGGARSMDYRAFRHERPDELASHF